jgi:hypothetical protein
MASSDHPKANEAKPSNRAAAAPTDPRDDRADATVEHEGDPNVTPGDETPGTPYDPK